MGDSEPMELVKCGRCGNTNNVPFGLSAFQCYSCGVTVRIEREQRAACAAASMTARVVHSRQQEASAAAAAGTPHSAGGYPAAVPTVVEGSPAEARKDSNLFGSFQKTVGKTMRKAEKAVSGTSKAVTGTVSSIVSGTILDPKPAEVTQPAHRQAPAKAAQALELSDEDADLQWALRESLLESGGGSAPSATVRGLPAGGESASLRGVPVGSVAAASQARVEQPVGADASCSSAVAAVRLQEAASEAVGKLQAAEDRAVKTEQELAAAKKRLADNQGIITSLTQQVDAINAEIEAKKGRASHLERALFAYRQSRGDGAKDEEGQDGVVSQLLARIAELETQMLRATHFAAEGETPQLGSPEKPAADSAKLSPTEEAIALSLQTAEEERLRQFGDISPNRVVQSGTASAQGLPAPGCGAAAEPPILADPGGACAESRAAPEEGGAAQSEFPPASSDSGEVRDEAKRGDLADVSLAATACSAGGDATGRPESDPHAQMRAKMEQRSLKIEAPELSEEPVPQPQAATSDSVGKGLLEPENGEEAAPQAQAATSSTADEGLNKSDTGEDASPKSQPAASSSAHEGLNKSDTGEEASPKSQPAVSSSADEGLSKSDTGEEASPKPQLATSSSADKRGCSNAEEEEEAH